MFNNIQTSANNTCQLWNLARNVHKSLYSFKQIDPLGCHRKANVSTHILSSTHSPKCSRNPQLCSRCPWGWMNSFRPQCVWNFLQCSLNTGGIWGRSQQEAHPYSICNHPEQHMDQQATQLVIYFHCKCYVRPWALGNFRKKKKKKQEGGFRIYSQSR